MIVFYSKPNLLILPYINSEGKKDKFKFVPGENEIEKDAWLGIRAAAGEDMDYYDTLLSVFQPVIDEKTQEQVGKNEDDIDFSKLNIREMAELIDNVMVKDKILKLKKIEKNRPKPRATVMKLIKEKLKQINAIEDAIKD